MFSDENFFIYSTELRWCAAGAVRILAGDGVTAFYMPGYPRFYDANTAHVLSDEADTLSLKELEARLLPLFRAYEAERISIWLPYGERQPELMKELSVAGYDRKNYLGLTDAESSERHPPLGKGEKTTGSAAPVPSDVEVAEVGVGASREEFNALVAEMASVDDRTNRPTPEDIVRIVAAKDASLGTRWFLGRVDGKAVGCLGMFPMENTGRFQNVQTLEAYRKRGVATALGLHAMEAFRRKGAARFALIASDDGPLSLYKSWGLEPAGSYTVWQKNMGEWG